RVCRGGGGVWGNGVGWGAFLPRSGAAMLLVVATSRLALACCAPRAAMRARGPAIFAASRSALGAAQLPSRAHADTSACCAGAGAAERKRDATNHTIQPPHHP